MSDENNYDGEEYVCETEVVPYESTEPNAGNSGKTEMVLNSISNAVSNASGLVSNTNDIVKTISSVIKIKQESKAKIEEIKAERDVEVQRIKAQTEIVKDVVNKSFAERKENFKAMHNVVEKAMEKGDNEALALALGSIVETQKHSVIKEIGETLKQGKNNQKKLSLQDEEW